MSDILEKKLIEALNRLDMQDNQLMLIKSQKVIALQKLDRIKRTIEPMDDLCTKSKSIYRTAILNIIDEEDE